MAWQFTYFEEVILESGLHRGRCSSVWKEIVAKRKQGICTNWSPEYPWGGWQGLRVDRQTKPEVGRP